MVLAASFALSARAADPAADEHASPAPSEPSSDPTSDAPPSDSQSSNDDGADVQPGESALPVVLGLGAGYGFRPHADGRNHGGTAHLYADIPLGFGFGIRPEVVGFAYAPSLDVDRPFAHPLAAASLVYAFDDTDAVAVVGVGGFVGAPLDLGRDDEAALTPGVGVPLSGGVLLSLGLRLSVIPGVRVEAGIRVPFALVEPPPPPGQDASNDLHTQIALTGGLVLVPTELWASAFD